MVAQIDMEAEVMDLQKMERQVEEMRASVNRCVVIHNEFWRRLAAGEPMPTLAEIDKLVGRGDGGSSI